MALPDDILYLILLERIKDTQGSFQTRFRLFRTLLNTCKRFNTFLDRPECWLVLGEALIPDHHSHYVSGIEHVMVPFYTHIGEENKIPGWSGIPMEPFIRDIYVKTLKPLTPEDKQKVKDLKKLLVLHYTQNELRLEKQRLLTAFKKKNIPNDVRFI